MALNDLYEIEVFSDVGSQPTMNVVHLLETQAEAETLAAPSIVMEAVLDSYTTLAARLSGNWRLIGAIARRIWPGPGIPYHYIGGGAEAVDGQVADQPVTPQSALLITFYTNSYGRTGRGRLYLPGFPQTRQFDGQLNDTEIGPMQVAVTNAFEGQRIPGTATTGIWRYYVAGPTTPPQTTHQIQQAVVRPNLATQQRRRARPRLSV